MKYWIVSPCPLTDIDLFEKIWQWNLKNEYLTLGWGEIGDPIGLDREALRKIISLTFKGISQKDCEYRADKISKFYTEMEIGDIVLIKKGKYDIIGLGVIQGKAFYSQDLSKELTSFIGGHQNKSFMRMKWESKDIKSPQILPGQIIRSISESDYNYLMGSKLTGEYLNTPVFHDEFMSLLLNTGQVVLYGPPGTGKTYNARKLAFELLKAD